MQVCAPTHPVFAVRLQILRHRNGPVPTCVQRWFPEQSASSPLPPLAQLLPWTPAPARLQSTTLIVPPAAVNRLHLKFAGQPPAAVFVGSQFEVQSFGMPAIGVPMLVCSSTHLPRGVPQSASASQYFLQLPNTPRQL